MGNQAWIYHKTEEPKIIDDDDMEKFKKKGWRESPAPFMKLDDFGYNKDDEQAGQHLSDAVKGVSDSLNGALNLDSMSKQELENYALEHYGKDIDRRKSKAKLIKEIREYIDGDSQ